MRQEFAVSTLFGALLSLGLLLLGVLGGWMVEVGFAWCGLVTMTVVCHVLSHSTKMCVCVCGGEGGVCMCVWGGGVAV